MKNVYAVKNKRPGFPRPHTFVKSKEFGFEHLHQVTE